MPWILNADFSNYTCWFEYYNEFSSRIYISQSLDRVHSRYKFYPLFKGNGIILKYFLGPDTLFGARGNSEEIIGSFRIPIDESAWYEEEAGMHNWHSMFIWRFYISILFMQFTV